MLVNPDSEIHSEFRSEIGCKNTLMTIDTRDYTHELALASLAQAAKRQISVPPPAIFILLHCKNLAYYVLH